MIGLPMLNGFVGEFLIFSSTFTDVSRSWAIAATVSVILSAGYMLWLVQRLFYGPQSDMTAGRAVNDLDFGEIAALVPLAILMLVMGIVPNYWLRAIQKNSPVTTPIHEVRSIPNPLSSDPVRNVAEAHP